MLDISSNIILTTCWWQNQKTIVKLHTIYGWIILNSIKYKECLWVKCISFIPAPFWNIIWFKKYKFKLFSHPWSCQPTHTKRKRKSTMSIFARFFFINILFCSVKKKYINFIYWIQKIIQTKYVFYENISSDIKYLLNFKIQSRLKNYDSY